MRLPTSIKGALLGLLSYDALLVFHLAKFETIAYGVPNVAGWAGRYPGYGWTWELTAINVPADLIDRVPSLRGRWVIPQVVTGHRVHIDEPKCWRPEADPEHDGERAPVREPRCWSATTWVITGVVGYAIAGLAFGVLASGGASLRRRWYSIQARRPRSGHLKGGRSLDRHA